MAQKDYEVGRQMYFDKKKRPPTPPDDNPCVSPEAHRWLGWMMARAEEVIALQKLCREAEVDTNSKGYERCLRVLDMEHKLSPFRKLDWSK